MVKAPIESLASDYDRVRRHKEQFRAERVALAIIHVEDARLILSRGRLDAADRADGKLAEALALLRRAC